MTQQISQKERPNIFFTVASGTTIAGIELLCGGHAMDRIKTYQQTYLNERLNVWSATQKIYTSRGFLGFYDGVRWNIVSHSAKAGLRWAVMSRMDEHASRWISPQTKQDYPWVQPLVLAALVTPIETCCIICPAESLKTKEMQSRLFHPISFIQKHGIRRILDGCDTVLARQFLSWASFLIGYKEATRWIITLSGKTSSKELSIQERFVAGALGGAINVAVVGPIDVVKTQMQKLHSTEYKNAYDAVKIIWQTHGPSGFTQGVPIKMVRSSWYAGVSLVMMQWLNIFNPHHA